jgi:predicted RNase H-like HicB family nuclease
LVEGGTLLLATFTAKYTRIARGYMGQLVEWPEVITEGRSLEECRSLLQDALSEMVAAYREAGREVPVTRGLLEQIPIELSDVRQAV